MLRKIGMIFLLAAVLLSGCGKSVEQQIAEQLELGNKYLTESDYEQAIVAFNKVIELDPKQADAYIGLTQVYVETSDFEKAVQILENGKAYLEDSYDERLKEVYKEQANSFSDDLEQINTFMTELAEQEYSNETFYLEMADIYREREMLNAEECCLQAGYHACRTDKIEERWDQVRDEHAKHLFEKGQRPNAGWWYSDFDNNGTHEMFINDRSVIDDAEALYNVECYYITDEEVEKLLSIQVKGRLSANRCTSSYAGFLYGESDGEIVNNYLIFSVENGVPQLVLSKENVNLPLEAARKEIEQLMDKD